MTESVIFNKAVNLGTRGLKITFPNDTKSNDKWIVYVPNTEIATYTETKADYEKEVANLEKTIVDTEVNLKVNLKSEEGFTVSCVDISEKMKAFGSKVYFIDETREIISYYQAAKIVVAPSFSEGFSLVTAEAMSCECSVIATKNVGVHSEIITNNKNGYLFEAGNVAELETLLSKSIEGEIPHLGKEARVEILQNWSAKKEAESLMEIYKA